MSIFNLGYSPMQIYAIPSQIGSLTFNGSEQFPVWKNFNSAQLQIGGITSATDAGSYTATFTPKPGFKWPDGTNVAKSVSWVIAKRTIGGTPSQNGSLTYNGSAQAPSWNGYDSAQLQIGGDTSATNAGSYTATFTPKPNHQWSDGSTGARNASWKIGKAAGSLSISPTSLSLSSSAPNKTITVTRAGNGAISATSSNTGVATVSVSGNTVTVKGVTTGAGGSTTITVKVAEGTNHTAPGNKTCAVSAVFRLTPEFTYSGDYEVVQDDDTPISDFGTWKGDWKIRFLTSGTLTITKMHGFTGKVDVFFLGGGGGGSGNDDGDSAGAGGGSGYTKTRKLINITTTSYPITIGAGAAGGGKSGAGAGGRSSAFDDYANGGNGGGGPSTTGGNVNPGGNGGSGGGAGGQSSKNGGAGGTNGGNGSKGGSYCSGGTGQGTNTREFGESTGNLYAAGGWGKDGGPPIVNNSGNGGNGRTSHSNWQSGYPGSSGIVIIRNARGGI